MYYIINMNTIIKILIAVVLICFILHLIAPFILIGLYFWFIEYILGESTQISLFI